MEAVPGVRAVQLVQTVVASLELRLDFTPGHERAQVWQEGRGATASAPCSPRARDGREATQACRGLERNPHGGKLRQVIVYTSTRVQIDAR